MKPEIGHPLNSSAGKIIRSFSFYSSGFVVEYQLISGDMHED